MEGARPNATEGVFAGGFAGTGDGDEGVSRKGTKDEEKGQRGGEARAAFRSHPKCKWQHAVRAEVSHDVDGERADGQAVMRVRMPSNGRRGKSRLGGSATGLGRSTAAADTLEKVKSGDGGPILLRITGCCCQATSEKEGR
eukprot:evm.model.NODE_5555_length_12449_cov_31.447346.6